MSQKRIFWAQAESAAPDPEIRETSLVFLKRFEISFPLPRTSSPLQGAHDNVHMTAKDEVHASQRVRWCDDTKG
jgi:hypothetical protein